MCAGALAASHSKYQRAEMNSDYTARIGTHEHFFADLKGSGARHDLNALLAYAIGKPLGVFGAGKLLAEILQAKARVNALLQNSARADIALNKNDALRAVFLCGYCRRQTRRTRADYRNVIQEFFHNLYLSNINC
jgi:hypothetical protein